MKQKMHIGFIGVGRITNAIVEGLCTSSIGKMQIYLSPRNETNAKRLAGKYEQVQRMDSNQQVIDKSDIVFFAIRPSAAMEVLQTLTFREDQVVVSLVPRFKEAALLTVIAPANRVIRAVPTPSVMQHTGPILLFNSNDTVTQLFQHLGQPVHVPDEQQLHVLWALTGLLTPYYDLLQELSSWTTANGADANTANQYIASLFQALSFSAQQTSPINFKELAQHAETPNGMNEQAGRQIRDAGAHHAYKNALDDLLKKFG